jgi:hypothetical protein
LKRFAKFLIIFAAILPLQYNYVKAESGYGPARIGAPITMLGFECKVSPCEGFYHDAWVRATHLKQRITRVDVIYVGNTLPPNSNKIFSKVYSLAQVVRMHSLQGGAVPDFALVKTLGKPTGVLDQANGILYKTHTEPDIVQPVDQVTYLSTADLAKLREVVPDWAGAGDLLKAALEPEKHSLADARPSKPGEREAKEIAARKALDYRVYAHLTFQLLDQLEPYLRDHKTPPEQLSRSLVMLRDTIVPQLEWNFKQVVADNSSYFNKYDMEMLPTELNELLAAKWDEAAKLGFKP